MKLYRRNTRNRALIVLDSHPHLSVDWDTHSLVIEISEMSGTRRKIYQIVLDETKELTQLRDILEVM